MTAHYCQEVFNVLPGDPASYHVQSLNNGLINRSFRVVPADGSPAFLLQEINLSVFPEPEKVQRNYERIDAHIRASGSDFRIPCMLYFPGGHNLFTDSRGHCWRMFSFIENGRTLRVPSNTEQAAAAAECFARFTAACEGLRFEQLYTVIPGFHDLALRYRQFTQTASDPVPARSLKAKEMTEEVIRRQQYVTLFENITRAGRLPLRIIHHDAKIANVLFRRDRDEVICPVDFDTCMPGYFFSDLGDLIRSMACSEGENEKDPGKIRIIPEAYKAITEGYTRGLGNLITGEEKQYLHVSGLFLIYMQTLRFLTDYLAGDPYYRIEYPEQNYDRALNQLTLLKSLEEFLQDTYNFTGRSIQ
ncbi:MAG: aminoglycoside phosphotransferase family protein [Chitinophagaceae bacterium]|nr:aminoglycoside phosphotransferase family protein [Chitinophagaceae bacterium]